MFAARRAGPSSALGPGTLPTTHNPHAGMPHPGGAPPNNPAWGQGPEAVPLAIQEAPAYQQPPLYQAGTGSLFQVPGVAGYAAGSSLGMGGARWRRPHRGSLILVLGILSLALCPLGVVLGPCAWSMGAADLNAMRRGGMDPAGMGVTQVGYICGIIGKLVSLGLIMLMCLYFALLAAALGASGV
ncbi:MAG: hypothetical protein K6T86_08000 [Pirellulales bacterium]|nr:hypothetical protein [Pirellulales bacterium]